MRSLFVKSNCQGSALLLIYSIVPLGFTAYFIWSGLCTGYVAGRKVMIWLNH